MITITTSALPAPSRYAKALEQCQDIVLIYSTSQLSELFDNLASTLTAHSDTHPNEASTGAALASAIEQIEQNRQQIEHVFRQELRLGFGAFRDAGGTSGVEPLGLELPLDPDEGTAAEDIIVRANAENFLELYSLSQRLSAINQGRRLNDFEIPAGPYRLVCAFGRSIKGLNVDARIRVLLYALFDKFVVSQAQSLYGDLNDVLKDAGLLPNLRQLHLRRINHGGRATSRGERASGHAENGGDDDEPEERHAVARPRRAEPRPRQAPAHLPVIDLDDPTAEPDAERQDLGRATVELIIGYLIARRQGRFIRSRRVSAVTIAGQPPEHPQLAAAIEQMPASAATLLPEVLDGVQVAELVVDPDFPVQVAEALERDRRQMLLQVDVTRIEEIDYALIELVGMLFESMLNKQGLANLAKALFVHLHVPYLKCALVDRTMLGDAKHPARRLLDRLVEAGAAWVDEKDPRHGIFPVMQKVVGRIATAPGRGPVPFAELLTDFEQAMRDHQRESARLEERTLEVARGHEKLLLAKRRVAEEIQAMLKRSTLPHPVVVFLSRIWFDYLVFILLHDKADERAAAWSDALQLAEDLRALFAPDIDENDREARARHIPQLREGILAGIQRMGGYKHPVLDALSTLLAAPEHWAANRVLPAGDNKPQYRDRARQTGSAQVGTAAEKELVEQLRTIKVGTWFEFHAERNAPRRVRLSRVSSLTSICTFTQGTSRQTETLTLQELARYILSGRGKIMPPPKSTFTERALQSIRRALEHEG